MRSLKPPAIVKHVGPYEVRAPIGKGAMGIVYEATSLTGEHVALKMLHHALLRDEATVHRFRDEAVAGLIVRHKNVTATLAHGETPAGIPFLVMERVGGELLGTRIRRDGLMSLRDAVEITCQILAGLAALHAAGIVHGDIKSDNVLVEPQPGGGHAVKLIDFGLACVEFSPDDSQKPTAVVCGTPEYMAPEVICGKGPSAVTDLYSVGVILYEMITGEPPFADGTPAEINRRHLVERVVPPSLQRTEVPSILERVVMRAVEKSASRRFPSAEAFASALAITLPVLPEDLVPRAPRTARETPTLNWARRAS